MSYEGHVQYICASGHYYEKDCNDDSICHCGQTYAWHNSVDDTNCDAYGVIPKALLAKFIISPAVILQCNLGHSHVDREDLYRAPSAEETKSMRHYWDHQKHMHVPIHMIGGDK